VRNKKIPIFIVNLKKDTEKKQHMQRLCKKYNLDVEFVEAVYGKELSQEEIDEVYSEKGAIERIGRGLTRGEIGTILSHRSIYKKILDEEIALALILEDDIEFNKELLGTLTQLKSFEDNWEIVLLGHHAGDSRKVATRYNVWYKKKLNEKVTLRRPSEIGYGAYGYVVNLKGAGKLYKKTNTCNLPIDHYTGNSKYTNLYIAEGPIIFIHENLTAMSNLNFERKVMEEEYSHNQKDSNLKKITKILGIYILLVQTRGGIKMFFEKIKPLQEYR